MRPLSPTLQAHQARVSGRRPAVAVTLHDERFGAPILRWQLLHAGSEADAPVALALTAAGTLLRVRNDGGVLRLARTPSPGPGAVFAAWADVAAGLEPGTGVGLASEGGEALAAGVLAGGTAVRVWRSSDDGQTWSAVHTAADPGPLRAAAVAIRSGGGDACLFLAAGAQMKRLRRTNGSWAASATAWPFVVGSVTGAAAVHRNGNYELLATGTAADGAPAVWACALGGGALPLNAWSGLVPVSEAGPGSGLSVRSPALAVVAGELRAWWTEEAVGSPAALRCYAARLVGGAPVTAHRWEEPAPSLPGGVRWATAASRAGVAWLATAAGVWRSAPAPAADVSALVLRAAWREAADGSFALTIELSDPQGAVVPGVAPAAAGAVVRVALGYCSAADGSPEFGRVLEGVIERARASEAGGMRRVVLEASGAWEWAERRIFARPWALASGSTSRREALERLAARLGLPSSVAATPSWESELLGLLAAPGERGTRLLRQLAGTGEVVLRGAEGALAVGLPGTSPVAAYGAGGHPLLGIERTDELPAANWVRAASSAGAGEAAELGSIAAHGPRLLLERRLAESGAGLEAAAGGLLAAFRRGRRAVRARIQADVGLEVSDAVTVEGVLGVVDAIAGEYRRGRRGATFEMLIDVGEV